MKLRCKGCQKKIEFADYKCPFCGKVNFGTDEEVRAAYNAHALKRVGAAHMPKGVGAAFAGAFVAVNSVVVIFIIIISAIIGTVIISIKEDNEWAFENVPKLIGFDKANSSERFEVTRVYSETSYPYYVMYITYDGEPEDFIRESILLCYDMYRNVDHRDEYSFSLKSGDMAFVCTQSHYVETNVLFDYSTLELLGPKTLTVHTDGMTDEDIHNIESGNYSFEVIFK
ncbi:MAG: hypothetical protein K2N38_11550 [Oscillospiraceae bacterium]|nr:hypothetical protein [Oscillospiraceae bacterium]